MPLSGGEADMSVFFLGDLANLCQLLVSLCGDPNGAMHDVIAV